MTAVIFRFCVVMVAGWIQQSRPAHVACGASDACSLVGCACHVPELRAPCTPARAHLKVAG